MNERTFDSFWIWCSAKRQLPRGGEVWVHGDTLKISGAANTRPYGISRKTAEEYFAIVANGGPCVSGYFKKAFKAYCANAPAFSRSSKGERADTTVDQGSSQSGKCICLCCLSRAFLEALKKRHKCLQTPGSYSADWIRWVIHGAQIKPYLKKGERVPIANILQEMLKDCAGGETFRRVWAKSISSLMVAGRSLGQAQKCVNLLSKYCFAYYFAEVDRQWMAANAWVAEAAAYFDIPIDQVVLRNTKRNYSSSAAATGIYVNGSKPNSSSGFICYHVNPHRRLPWNQLGCHECYAEMQAFARETSREAGYIFPMEFEMHRLWCL